MNFNKLLPIAFAALGAVVVLWQLLGAGYVLTLDLVFGPHPVFPPFSGVSITTFFPSYLIYLAEHVVSGSIVEKGVLFALFFCLFYFPIKFYPFVRGKGIEYVVAIFYAINPFVYERLLAGQWKVLAGYALLFPFVALIIRFWQEASWQLLLRIYTCLFLIMLFSSHISVMAVLVLNFFALVLVVTSAKGDSAFLNKKLALLAPALLLLAGGYFVAPYLLTGHNVVSSFTESNWQAFKTASDEHVGTVGNVAALYGFWMEHEHWASRFITPKNISWTPFAGAALALLILVGVFAGLYTKRLRAVALTLFATGFFALVFSAGFGEGIFHGVNLWLFNHIWFWSGFRDTEKWSAVLVVVYALFAGLGLEYVCERYVPSKKMQKIIILFACMLPILYAPTMLFGLAGQLQPVAYPSGWSQANDVFKKDPHCKAVFLPWHQYYTPVFANRVLTANTSSAYFDCTILSGKNAEIGDVGDQAGNTAEYYAVEAAVTSNTANPDATVRLLASKGVRYIIFTPDEVHDDSYKYPFLRSTLLNKIVQNQSLALFALPL